MKKIWHKLLTLGVINSLEELDIKHIKLLNALTTFSGLFSLSYLAIEIPYYPLTRWLIVCLLIILASFFTVLWLNYQSRFLAARLLFNLAGIAHISIHALVLDAQVNAQFFLLLVIMTAFFIYPKSERTYQYAIIGLTTVIFILFEVYFYFFPQALLVIPDSLLILFKLSFSLGLLIFLLGFSYYIASHYEQAEQLLALEKKYSDDLLHSILPDTIVKRLKAEPGIIADRFEATTILFADIVGFTKLSEKTPPAHLVTLLNKMFSVFDELTNDYGLEKIKTMGDAYMVAGGLPVASKDHAQAIADLALDMRIKLAEFNQQQQQNFNIRIGIHTGPVIAGVIGIKKFVYDIWGDTVNTASRMESHGIPGQIQVSEATYQILKDQYQFEERGVIEIKGKGEMRVYLLKGKNSC
jgi:class 3 adenylate cyclase